MPILFPINQKSNQTNSRSASQERKRSPQSADERMRLAQLSVFDQEVADLNRGEAEDRALVGQKMMRMEETGKRSFREAFGNPDFSERSKLATLLGMSLLDSFGSREEASEFIRKETRSRDKRLREMRRSSEFPAQELILELFRPWLGDEEMDESLQEGAMPPKLWS